MPSPSSDRNLLFGVLALRMDFVTREELAAALDTWRKDKSRTLGDILVASGAIDRETHGVLAALVERHIAAHGNDAEQSLSSVAIDASTREKLCHAAADEIAATLLQVSDASSRTGDPGGHPERTARAPGDRYRIVRRHAEGGLGEVYVAEDAELGRNVALKIMHHRLSADDRRRARFLLEAEITGGLEHPGIVPVYGVGAYSDGRPFYAMRFIKGENLKQGIAKFHASGAGFLSLAFRDLLARFIDVCNAVAYAHSRGVLHRDLKPGNVMLGKFGETLVVDWGLAKAQSNRDVDGADPETPLFGSRSDDQSATVLGTALGTPAYMPPEQAEGRLDDLGPASDVYSLGATLYEILAGRAPFAGQATEVIEQVQRGAFVPPRQVQPLAPAALEAVCLRAMSHRPANRYGSALEVAEEVKHWLADEPVRAHAEPLRGRAGRWMRRHRPFVAGAAALLVTAAAALAVSLFIVDSKQRQTELALHNEERQREQAELQRRRAVQKQAEAETEREKQTELTDFLTQMFQASDPLGMQGFQFARMTGEPMTVRRVLDGAYDRLKQDRGTMNPVVKASLQEKLGNVYRTLAQYDRAGELLTSAHALSAAHLPADHDDRINSMQSLAWLLEEKGHYEKAEEIFRAVMAQRSRLPETDPRVAAAKFNLAMLLTEMDAFEEGERLFKDVIRLREMSKPDSRELMIAHFGLAALYLEDGRLSLAAKPILESIRILKKVDQGSLAEAVPLFQAGVMLSQGLGQHAMGAEKMKESLAIIRRTNLGEQHLYVALVWGTLGATQLKMKDLAAAEDSFRQCADILRNTVGIEHPRTSDLVRWYADTLRGLGRTPEADALFEELVAKRRERFGSTHWGVGDALRAYGLFQRDGGNLADAERRAREAVQVYRESGRMKTERALWSLFHEASAILRQNKPASEAERVLREAHGLLPGVKRIRENTLHVEVPLLLAEALLRQMQSGNEVAALLTQARSATDSLSAEDRERPLVTIDGRTIRMHLLAQRFDEADAGAAELASKRSGNPAVEFERARELSRCRTLALKLRGDRLEDRYADYVYAAMHSSFSKGFRDFAVCRRDSDLAPLCARPEFVALLWEWADAPALPR